jgi:RNA-directed DNA polymerase
VVFGTSREDAVRVKERLLPPWLAVRGLALSAEQTRIVHLTEGFDFLGTNVRPYEAPQTTRSGYKRLIKPSAKAVKARRQKLRDEWRAWRGHNIHQVLHRLNPLIRGWAEYHRHVVAAKTFSALDAWMSRRTRRYVKTTHRQKPWHWLKARYWGRLNKERKDTLVFGDKRSGHHLLKFSWFKIIRPPLVRGRSSPDDPSLRDYWWQRRQVEAKRLCASDQKLGAAQNWTCRRCGMALRNGEEIHRHHKEAKAVGGSEAYSNRELVPLYCHQQERQRQNQEGRRTAAEEERL